MLAQTGCIYWAIWTMRIFRQKVHCKTVLKIVPDSGMVTTLCLKKRTNFETD